MPVVRKEKIAGWENYPVAESYTLMPGNVGYFD
jgi:hypothetical protein